MRCLTHAEQNELVLKRLREINKPVTTEELVHLIGHEVYPMSDNYHSRRTGLAAALRRLERSGHVSLLAKKGRYLVYTLTSQETKEEEAARVFDELKHKLSGQQSLPLPPVTPPAPKTPGSITINGEEYVKASEVQPSRPSFKYRVLRVSEVQTLNGTHYEMTVQPEGSIYLDLSPRQTISITPMEG